MGKIILKKYRIKAAVSKPVKIALAADLHESDPTKAIECLRQAAPDMICIAGDTFERFDLKNCPCRRGEYGIFTKLLLYIDDVFEWFAGERKHSSEYAYRFLREAVKIAPVYMGLGNHEEYLLPKDRQVIKETGVTLLDNADIAAEQKSTLFCIGGLSPNPNLKWLKKFCEKEEYKILLCHHPEYYERYLKDKKLNLIFSGHAHGGQIRLLGRGIFAPGQGLFPKYTKGIYDKKLVVSAGCSNTASIPRFGNPCEIILIQLTPGKENQG